MTPKERAKQIVSALSSGGRFVPSANYYPGTIAGLDHLEIAIEQEIAAAVAAERERCATVAEKTPPCIGLAGVADPAHAFAAQVIAQRIRTEPV